MKKILWYIPIIGCYFVMRSIVNGEIDNCLAHYVGTWVIQSLSIGLAGVILNYI